MQRYKKKKAIIDCHSVCAFEQSCYLLIIKEFLVRLFVEMKFLLNFKFFHNIGRR